MGKLIKNVNVFNGIDEALLPSASIVIEGNMIVNITQEILDETAFATVIDGNGKTAIPGLIDAHMHLSLSDRNLPNLDTMTIDEQAIRAAKIAEDTLFRGFTTVRTLGSLDVGLKRCIDNGYATGPRIFPSHSAIAQTCGHGDWRQNRAQTRGFWGEDSAIMKGKAFVIADGVPEILKTVRQQLYLGASLFKIMAGGGATSRRDPLETSQFTLEEMKAAVDAASDYGTYVVAHIHTKKSMLRAMEAGVMCFEHATFMDEEVAQLMAEKGVWLCTQYALANSIANRLIKQPSEAVYQRKEMVGKAVLALAPLAQKYGIKQVFGTEFVGDRQTQAQQLTDFTARKEVFGSFEALKQATGYANELFQLTTCMNPYPEGEVGILTTGSFADLLLIEGNPVEDVDILTDTNNMKLIMKDGEIFKNTL